jgi:hypothetical protein
VLYDSSIMRVFHTYYSASMKAITYINLSIYKDNSRFDNSHFSYMWHSTVPTGNLQWPWRRCKPNKIFLKLFTCSFVYSVTPFYTPVYVQCADRFFLFLIYCLLNVHKKSKLFRIFLPAISSEMHQ